MGLCALQMCIMQLSPQSCLELKLPWCNGGVREDPGSYEPASLTSLSGSTMEKIKLDCTEGHLKTSDTVNMSSREESPVSLLWYPSTIRSPAWCEKGRWQMYFSEFLLRLLIPPLTASFWTSCPSLGWVVTHWTGWTAGCKGLRWMRLHLAGDQSPSVFLRISSRASAVQNTCEWSGGTNWMPH